MTPYQTSRPIPVVVRQHAEESAILYNVRTSLVRAGHVKLHHLHRLDERLAAHLGGLAIAGEYGWRLCEEGLAAPSVAQVFATAVCAIEGRSADRFATLLALVQAEPELLSGMFGAIAWVSADRARSIARTTKDSPTAFLRQVAIAAFTLHRIDPAESLSAALSDADAGVRAWALRASGECGRRDLLGACLRALGDQDGGCRLQAARSAALLGDRNSALQSLQDIARRPGPDRAGALALLLRVLVAARARTILRQLFEEPLGVRDLVRAIGAAGDPHFVPWLIGQMANPKLARLAGESFSLITGLDLAWMDLELKPPEGVDFGPSDDPEDDNVAMDEDDGLPWPDPAKLQAWWASNSARFQPGARYFMGAPVTAEHCDQVLREGYQPQRMAAAQYLCLLRPGATLFDCEAPASRQQSALAKAQ